MGGRQRRQASRPTLAILARHMRRRHIGTTESQPQSHTPERGRTMSTLAISTIEDALCALDAAWPHIVEDCRSVLGGELHYQAMIYHCLRTSGISRFQIGMNVKQLIITPISTLFQSLDIRKHENFRGGFEPIPDIIIFTSAVEGDWRRRNKEVTLANMLLAIEVKASERAKGRLSVREIQRDIEKLAAHRDEVRHRGADMHPVMMVVDTAPDLNERMPEASADQCIGLAEAAKVAFFYLSPTTTHSVRNHERPTSP